MGCLVDALAYLQWVGMLRASTAWTIAAESRLWSRRSVYLPIASDQSGWVEAIVFVCACAKLPVWHGRGSPLAACGWVGMQQGLIYTMGGHRPGFLLGCVCGRA